MEEWTECVIYYPFIEHPLRAEKDTLKRKYVALLWKYAEKYDSNEHIDEKINVFYRALFGEQKEKIKKEEYSQEIEAQILRTRFTPFKFFSYRYIFLFDCLLLYAVEDEDKGYSICEDFKNHVHNRYHKKIETMVRKMYEGDGGFADRTLITDEMVKAWNKVRRYAESTERNLYFTATMSAGKSTLINAIAGDNLSGTKNAACTSKVIKIHSTPTKNGIFAVLERTKWRYLNDLNVTRKYVQENENDTELTVYFCSRLNDGRFTLVDTPGVNSCLHPEHKKIARKALEGNIETIVYVIPVETWGSEDDDNHLRYILKKVSYKRIVFVVNMMDTIDSEDDSVEDILSEISDYLQQIGFQNPVICPVSAKAGLQIKKIISGAEMTANEMESARKFINFFSKAEYALGGYGPAVSESEKEGYCCLSDKCDERLWSAFVGTGIPGLEKQLYSE